MCRTPFIAMMDADDIALPHRLEAQCEFLRNHPDVDVVGSHVLVIDQFGETTGLRRYPVRHQHIISAIDRIVPFCHPSVTVRRATLLRAGGYKDNGFPIEDYELWSRMAKQGATFSNYPEFLLKYRVHKSQVKALRMRSCIAGVIAVKNTYWRDRMAIRARIRFLIEHILLCMPSWLVYVALLYLYYGYHRVVLSRMAACYRLCINTFSFHAPANSLNGTGCSNNGRLKRRRRSARESPQPRVVGGP